MSESMRGDGNRSQSGGASGKEAITTLLWVASSIAISTSITVWMINTHGNGIHSGSVEESVFNEYRRSEESRRQYLEKVQDESDNRNDKYFQTLDTRLNNIEKAMINIEKVLVSYEPAQHPRQNPLFPQREYNKPDVPD